MFTRFKDFFKPDKIDKNNSRRYLSNSGWQEYTQEELDDNLFKAIDDEDYDTFVDMVKRGANINKISNMNSPIINIIYGAPSSKNKYKFLKSLFEAGVKLFGYMGYGPHLFEIDIYDSIIKLVHPDYRQRTLDCLLRNYPNYMEDREIRKDIDKFNLYSFFDFKL